MNTCGVGGAGYASRHTECEPPPQVYDPAWSSETPHLPQVSEPNGCAPHLPTTIETTEVNEPGRLKRFGTAFRKKWDRGTLAGMSRLATPAILLGIGLALLGTIGIITAFSGSHIPGFHMITRHAPVSLFLSLLMIRTGIHAINTGTRLSKRKQQVRQDVIRCHTLFHIEQNIRNAGEEMVYGAKEPTRRNLRVAPSERVGNTLINTPYGKQNGDIPHIRRVSNRFFALMKWLAPPELEMPCWTPNLQKRPLIDELDIPTPTMEKKPCSTTFSNTWYDWWQARLPLLGKLDMALGVVMALTGLAALLLLTPIPVPSGFEMLMADPMLSISFAFLLLINSISCISTGWQMLDNSNEEKTRAREELELQKIDRAIEMKRAKDLYIYVRERTENAQVRAQIEEAYNQFLLECPKMDLRADFEPPKPESVYSRCGRSMTSRLSTPTIMLGILITSIGVALLTMAATKQIPPDLAFLVSKPTLSILFASTLIVSGLHAVHHGTSGGDARVRSEWDKLSLDYRKEMLNMLFQELPEIEPAQNFRARQGHRLVPDEIAIRRVNRRKSIAKIRSRLEKIATAEPNRWYRGWMTTFKGMWLPDLAFGTFILVCGLAGIAFALGAPVPASLEFIVKTPSYSIIFCLGLLGVAIGSFDSAWEIGTYHKQRKERHDNLKILERCYSELYDLDTQLLRVDQKV